MMNIGLIMSGLGLLSSLFDPNKQTEVPEELKAALEIIKQRAAEGLSRKEEAELVNQLKAQLANEAAASKALIDKQLGGRQDSGAYMAALRRLSRQRLQALGQGVSRIQQLDEATKRQAENALANAGLLKYNLDAYRNQLENTQRPWGSLMGAGMKLWAMDRYLKQLKENIPSLDAGSKRNYPAFDQLAPRYDLFKEWQKRFGTNWRNRG